MPMANSAFHPTGVGKWRPPLAGKTNQDGLCDEVTSWRSAVSSILYFYLMWTSVDNVRVWQFRFCYRLSKVDLTVLSLARLPLVLGSVNRLWSRWCTTWLFLCALKSLYAILAARWYRHITSVVETIQTGDSAWIWDLKIPGQPYSFIHCYTTRVAHDTCTYIHKNIQLRNTEYKSMTLL